VKPACVAYKVEGKREGDVNPREAHAIVSLIQAMTRHPAYAGKTIGVISMVKEDQALLIQSLLHKRVDSVEIDRRRILAGLAAEFQGDERDIMFLSLLDSSPGEDSTLRTLREGAFELVKNGVTPSRLRIGFQAQVGIVHGTFDAALEKNAEKVCQSEIRPLHARFVVEGSFVSGDQAAAARRIIPELLTLSV